MRLGYLIFPVLLALAFLLSCEEEEVFTAEVTRITLEADKTILTADDEDVITLSAEAFDQNDEPMPGANITYYADGQALSSNLFKTSSFGDYTLEAKANGINSNTIDVVAERVELEFEIAVGTYFPLQTAAVDLQEGIDVNLIDTVMVGDEITSITSGDSADYIMQIPILPSGEYKVSFLYEDVVYKSNISIQEHDFEEQTPEVFVDNYINEKNEFVSTGINEVTGLSGNNKDAIKAAWSAALDEINSLVGEDKIKLANYLKTINLSSQTDSQNEGGRFLRTASDDDGIFDNEYKCQNATEELENGISVLRGLNSTSNIPDNLANIVPIVRLSLFIELLNTAEGLKGCLSQPLILKDITSPIYSTIETMNQEYGLNAASILATYTLNQINGIFLSLEEEDRNQIQNEEVTKTFKVIDEFKELWNDIKEENEIEVQEDFNFFTKNRKSLVIPTQLLKFETEPIIHQDINVMVETEYISDTELNFSFSFSKLPELYSGSTLINLFIAYQSKFNTYRRGAGGVVVSIPNGGEQHIKSLPELPDNWWGNLEDPLKNKFNEIMGRDDMGTPLLGELINLFCKYETVRTNGKYTLDLSSLGLTNGAVTNILPYFYDLGSVDLSSNSLSGELDFSRIEDLQFINISDNNITDIEIGGLENLYTLAALNNNLTSLNLSGLSNLKSVLVPNNRLTKLDLSGLGKLQFVSAEQNQISELSTNSHPELYSLDLKDNQLDQIDLSGFPNLESLFLRQNELYEVDLSELHNLEYADLSHNKLSLTLDCSNNEKLRGLNLSNNELLNIELPSNPNFDAVSRYFKYGGLPNEANLPGIYFDQGLNLTSNPGISSQNMLSIMDRMPVPFGWGCVGNQISMSRIPSSRPGLPPTSTCDSCERYYQAIFGTHSVEWWITSGYSELDKLIPYYGSR